MSAFDKIIGYDSIKTELKRICDCWKYPEKYEKLGAKPPKALLLYGVPGIGKTFFATCMMEESGLPYFVLRRENADEAFMEEMKKKFEEAKGVAPSILLLDDMDKFSNDSHENHLDAKEYVAIQSLMDDAKNCAVYFIATTNSIRYLPDSLLRSGRFGLQIHMNLPSSADMEKIVRHYLEGKKIVSENIKLNDFAGVLVEKSCADVESVINSAAIYAGYEHREFVTQEDLIHACLRELFYVTDLLTEKSPEVRRRHAYHEAGHAVIAEFLEPGSVNLISIKSGDGMKGGFTSFNINREYKCRICYQENQVMSSLGGKAATELVFGEVDTGVVSDLDSATEMLERFRDFYAAYGFDKRINPFRHFDTTDMVAEQFVAGQLELYYRKTKSILIEHRPFLDALAKELEEKEMLFGSDVRCIRKAVEA